MDSTAEFVDSSPPPSLSLFNPWADPEWMVTIIHTIHVANPAEATGDLRDVFDEYVRVCRIAGLTQFSTNRFVGTFKTGRPECR